jgi:hypothetical protein
MNKVFSHRPRLHVLYGAVCLWRQERVKILFKGTVQRDLRGGGGQKWYQSIGLPLSYQRFALDFNFIWPPFRNSRKTIQRKLIQITIHAIGVTPGI